jgi:hypothetical protein
LIVNPEPIAIEIKKDEAVDFETLDDQAREALKLGFDYPGGGMASLLDLGNFVSIVLEGSWIPVEFVPFVGFPVEGNCSFCNHDFSEWQGIGQVFLAIDREDPSLVIRDAVGCYCARCVERFGRWSQAIGILAARAHRREVEA